MTSAMPDASAADAEARTDGLPSTAPPAPPWLGDVVAAAPALTPDALLSTFLERQAERGIALYEAQEEAMLALSAGQHVLLATPTGSGKSLVAVFLHALSASAGRRSVYTSPIKALVHEKFFALCRDFGASNVGMLTGDASVNRDAPILCATAEVLANMALSPDAAAQVHDVVMDEFHYYGDVARGTAWQLPLLTLPHAQFLLMSATMGDISAVQSALQAETGRPCAYVHSTARPVPLDYRYSEVPLQETVDTLSHGGGAPAYVVHFTQREAVQNAQAFTSLDVCSKAEKQAIAQATEGFRFDSPFGATMRRLVHHGIGLHHAGLLPKYRLLCETLAQKGLLKVILGTDTLGVGINVPIRTVVFTALCKYDGVKVGIVTAREFHQIAGRAGRKGYDAQGSVLCQAPEHVIENRRMESRVLGDAKKLRKLVRKKPPGRNFVPWDATTFAKLQAATAETIRSQFRLSYHLLCTLLRVRSNGYRALVDLIARCHEAPRQKQLLRREARKMAQVLQRAGLATPTAHERGRTLGLAAGLGDDFSLTHALSLFAFDAFELLDAASPTYPLDVLSVVESILASPPAIMKKLYDAARQEAFDRLRAEGVAYEERQAELEAVEFDKPLADLLYPAFDQWQAQNPWAADATVRPKSIARRLIEDAAGFAAFVKRLGLERAEGVLLRYMADVVQTLTRSLPPQTLTAEVEELTAYLRALVAQVDASLLQAWEDLLSSAAGASGAPVPVPELAQAGAPQTVGEAFEREPKALLARLRGELQCVAVALAENDADALAASLRFDDAEDDPSDDASLGSAAGSLVAPPRPVGESEQREARVLLEKAASAVASHGPLGRTPLFKQAERTHVRLLGDELEVVLDLFARTGEHAASLCVRVPLAVLLSTTRPLAALDRFEVF